MKAEYPVLDTLSSAYPRVKGRLLTCYSPVRHSCTPKGLTVRLACVKHAASVRPEPGSNSPLKNIDSHKGESSTSTSLKPDRTKKLAQSIFILKETITTKPSPKRNVSMATGNNLALTLSTLLSSQVSGTTTKIPQDPSEATQQTIPDQNHQVKTQQTRPSTIHQPIKRPPKTTPKKELPPTIPIKAIFTYQPPQKNQNPPEATRPTIA